MAYLGLRDLQFPDPGNHLETAQWKMNLAEWLVRVILCAGFIAVLAVEISLLIQALSNFG